jgi:hypothetical protein
MILPNEYGHAAGAPAPGPKFAPGQVVATPAALAAVQPDEIRLALDHHFAGDWGTVSAEDAAANNLALRTGERIISAWRDTGGTKFWIITEADRSATTVLLPSDY